MNTASREIGEPGTEEDQWLIKRLSGLLAEIAIIVNGPEEPRGRWGYADLPEKVRALAHTGQAAPVALENPTMEDALAAAEGTLHGAIDYWQARARKAEAALAAPAGEVASERMRRALTIIANWTLPATGKFWDAEKTRPTSYEAEYGSSGARDYMRNLAAQTLLATAATEPAAPGYVSDAEIDALRRGPLMDKKSKREFARAVLAAASTVQGKEKP